MILFVESFASKFWFLDLHQVLGVIKWKTKKMREF